MRPSSNATGLSVTRLLRVVRIPTADLCSECRVGEQAAFRAAPLVSATGKSGRRHNDKGMRGRRPALAGASELAS